MTDTIFEPRAGPSGYDAAPLHVSVPSEGPPAWVIEVRGELDLFSAPMLKQRLEPYNIPYPNSGRPSEIVYLLPELEFIDLSGLDALLGAADGHGPETITIREPSSQVRRLLELVNMDALIEERANR